jgi:AcrR family transcriptional regulator
MTRRAESFAGVQTQNWVDVMPAAKRAAERPGRHGRPGGKSEPTDGRTARSHRSRRAIVDAMRALHAEGDLRPTAPRIAERAGVSLRTVWQQFTDMETLRRGGAGREAEAPG